MTSSSRGDKSWGVNWFRFREAAVINAKTRRTGRKPADAPWGNQEIKACRSSETAGFQPWRFSETVQDLVGPEPLEPVQRLVQRRELFIRDTTDLLDSLDVLLIERVDDAADLLALRRQADADRAAINARALMIEEAELDQLLQVVGDIGAEVVAARAQ